MQAVRAVIARTAFSILRGLVQSAMARGPLPYSGRKRRSLRRVIPMKVRLIVIPNDCRSSARRRD
jgi:hypothetical protein